jgi:hypothetical protein
MCARMYKCVCICECKYVCCAYMYVYMYVHIYTYICMPPNRVRSLCYCVSTPHSMLLCFCNKIHSRLHQALSRSNLCSLFLTCISQDIFPNDLGIISPNPANDYLYCEYIFCVVDARHLGRHTFSFEVQPKKNMPACLVVSPALFSNECMCCMLVKMDAHVHACHESRVSTFSQDNYAAYMSILEALLKHANRRTYAHNAYTRTMHARAHACIKTQYM